MSIAISRNNYIYVQNMLNKYLNTIPESNKNGIQQNIKVNLNFNKKF